MKTGLWLAIAVLAGPCLGLAASREPPRATLVPAQEDEPGPRRLATATLTLENTGKEPVERVSLRWVVGGPRFVFQLPVAPGMSNERIVRLPAIETNQQWQVDLLGSEADLIASTTAKIRWPIERVSPGSLISPDLYRRFRSDLPRWDARLRTNLLAVAIITVLAMAALAWMHQSRVRLIALALVVCASTAAAGWLISSRPVVLRRELPAGTDGHGLGQRVLVLTTRRTRRHSVDRGDYIPLYRSPEHMFSDETVLRESGGFETRLSPERPTIMLIRSPGRRDLPPETPRRTPRPAIR